MCAPAPTTSSRMLTAAMTGTWAFRRAGQQLEQQIQAPLQPGGVEHADDGPGARIAQREVEPLDGHPLVEGQRLQRVDAGEVVDGQAAGVSGADLHRHPGIVGDLLGNAGEPGEEQALPELGLPTRRTSPRSAVAVIAAGGAQ